MKDFTEPPPPAWVAHNDLAFAIRDKCPVVGAAARSGLRIEGTFEPRTVSLLDLGWVIAADTDVTEEGGVLDEEPVNRLRYLEGTPKGSTRWIDTQWALAAWSKAKPLLPLASTRSAS